MTADGEQSKTKQKVRLNCLPTSPFQMPFRSHSSNEGSSSNRNLFESTDQ